MADNKIQIWAELTIDDKKLKTEFTKAWEEAGKSVAQWLEKSQWNMLDLINETVEKIRWKIETLQEMDWNLIDPNKIEPEMKFLDTELTTLKYNIENLKYWRWEFWDEWKEAFEELKATAEEYEDTIYNSMDVLQTMWMKGWEAMDELEEQTREAKEEVQKLNDTADKWISENGWLWKMLKFLTSKEIFNFFYNNLKKIWTKLIELSGQGEMLAEKSQPIQDKLETVWWYIWTGLVPAVEWAIDEISAMTDELIKVGEDWSSSMDMLQKWVYRIWQWFLAVFKVIKQFWAYLWTQIGNRYVLVDSFWRDFYDTAKSVIEWIGNADNWIALWDNIKYWLLKWVNEAIGWINGMLKWLKSNLWVNLWTIDTIWPWKTKSFNFWNFEFTRTKEALKDIARTNVDFVKEVWDEWRNAWDRAKEWAEKLVNYTEFANSRIKKDTQEKIAWWGWWSKKDSVKWAYEELEETAVDVWEELSGLVDEHQRDYDKLVEQIDKIWDEYDKLRDKAKDTRKEAESALKDYDDELQKSQAETITDLWQRYVDLKRELIWVDEYMKRIANELSRKELQSMQDLWYNEYRWYDLKKIIELKEKLDEIQLIEENTTEEQRKSDEFTKETSKTQEILNKLKEKELELEAKKTAELEKQAIAQAIIDQENWKQYIQTVEGKWTYYYDKVKWIWEQIQDEDNIQYAKQLELQTENLNEQLDGFKKEKDSEVEILIDTTAAKIDLENNYTKVFEESTKKQEKLLDNLIVKEQQLVDLRREYLSMWWSVGHYAYWWSILSWQASIVWENWPEQIIARQSSYVQPRNAGNSYSTVNSNSLTINWIEFWNFDTVDDMLNALKEKLTYRS